MKKTVLTCLIVCFHALPAYTQTFNCYNQGSYSECQVPDGSQIRCYSYNGGAYSNCQIIHANGFVSTSDTGTNTPVGELGVLIAWIIQTHAQHVTNKAIGNINSTVLLNIKYSMIWMDFSTYMERLASHEPPEQRGSTEELARALAKQSSDISEDMSVLLANWSKASPLSIQRAAKDIQKSYDSMLAPVCEMQLVFERSSDKQEALAKTLPNLPADVGQALGAIRADEALLDPECTSPRALKLLKKRAEKAKRAEARPPGN
jgi:hypothetical protein